VDQETDINEQIELVNRIKGGDKDAETLLYEKYRNRFFYYTKRKMFLTAGMVDVALVQDICQDAWVAVLENLRGGELEKPEKLVSYIYQIFSNKIIDSIKISQREKSLKDLERSNVRPLLIDDSQITSGHKEAFTKVWRELKSKEKRILYLKFIQGWTHTQVSQILGISEENSRKILQRAKERMRKKLGKII
jgi:RNA polymerase sigma factor (sigma-70 family)